MLKFVQNTRQPLSFTRFLHTTKRRQGYIVLVPEIGEEGQSAESLVKLDGLPAFNEITIENCLGTVGQQAAAVEKAVRTIESDITQNGGQVQPARIFNELDEAAGPLDTTWGIAKAIYLGNSTLIPTKSYMNIHERARNVRAAKYCNKVIFEALHKYAEQDKSGLTAENNDEKRLLQKFLLEGRLNGLQLKRDEHDGLKQLLMQLGRERAQFKNKVNMSVHTFTHFVSDQQIVRDFPNTLLEAISKDPNQPMNGPWKITLQPQIVDGFLKYCPDRNERWNLWQANARKASSQQEKSLENSTHLEKIRGLRLRQANILGYKNFAELSMQTKMVGSVENLKKVFQQLLEYAGPAQSAELEELHKFAKECGAEQNLEMYDVSFWQRKYLLSKHQLNEESLREFFPLPRVFSGLFSLSEKLFNIKIVERKEAQVWQPAVKYFDVFDADLNDGNKPIAGFYVDCYSKENRFGKNNGWMVGIRNRNKAANLTPLCALIFNFSEPVYAKPYLLSYEDLKMVFKTFGSAMQHLLTQASYSDLAGSSNIEWDASQVSGYVMSNFLDNPTILKSVSGHYGNDEPLPDKLAADTQLLKTHMAGYQLCQELYFADLDIELHRSKDFWLDVVRRMWPIYRCLPLDKKDCHPCSMTEIFSGDWAAAQFSHLYSKMLAADVNAAFLEQDSNASDVGKRFKQTFLRLGGSVPSAEVFRRFRGRDPSVEALLKSLNIHKSSQSSGQL